MIQVYPSYIEAGGTKDMEQLQCFGGMQTWMEFSLTQAAFRNPELVGQQPRTSWAACTEGVWYSMYSVRPTLMLTVPELVAAFADLQMQTVAAPFKFCCNSSQHLATHLFIIAVQWLLVGYSPKNNMTKVYTERPSKLAGPFLSNRFTGTVQTRSPKIFKIFQKWVDRAWSKAS